MAKTCTMWKVPEFRTEGPQWGQLFTAAAIAVCVWGESPYEALSDNLAAQEIVERASSTAVEVSDLGLFQEVVEFVSKYHLNKNMNWKDWAVDMGVLEQRVGNGELSGGQAAKLLVNKLGDRYSRILSGSTFYSSLSDYDVLGVGVLLAPGKDGGLEVISPPKIGSSANAKGIQQGDVITAINGHSTSAMNPFEAIESSSMLTEPVITFSIEREGKDVGNIELIRSFADVTNPITYKLVTLPQLGDHKVGYVRILEFNSVAAERLKDAMEDLKSQGSDEYILDLRGNKGGAFQSAISVANLFMNHHQPIASVFDGQGERISFYTGNGEAITSDPLIVWIDGGSASASEVLAGALRDDCRALLVGRKSYGKGIIQAVFGLSDGNALILTVAKYLTPCGRDLHGNGITPDVLSSPLFPIFGTTISQDDFERARYLQSSSRYCSPIPLGRDSSTKIIS